MPSTPKDLTSFSWDSEVLDAEGTVLVDFWAPWCPSCRSLAPALETAAARFDGRVTVGKLNIDENPELAERYAVRSIPTLVVFRNGKPVARRLGALSEERLIGFLEAEAGATDEKETLPAASVR